MSIFLEWMESHLITRIPDVDAQHQEFIQHVDTLIESMKKGKGCDEIIPLIQFMENYLVAHFKTEEKLMQTYSYPGLRQHLLEHGRFLKKYQASKESFKESGSCSAWVVQFQFLVREWIKTHIAKTDMQMAEYINGRLHGESEK